MLRLMLPLDGTKSASGEELEVVKNRLALAASMAGVALLVAGCQHHLVAAPGDTTVAIYPDRQTYDKLADLKSRGRWARSPAESGKGSRRRMSMIKRR
jgi:hypothetical protein